MGQELFLTWIAILVADVLICGQTGMNGILTASTASAERNR